MRTVRFLVPLVAAAFGLLLLPNVATADPYPIGSPLLTVSNSTTTVGNTEQVYGSGWDSGGTVTLDVVYSTALGPAGSQMVPVSYTAQQRKAIVVQADAQGNFVVDVTFDQVGLAVITGTGFPSGVTASVSVRVLPAGAQLPVTGENNPALRIALIGSVVLAAGAVLLVLVRSRRRRAGVHS